jgi:hypothetical protein
LIDAERWIPAAFTIPVDCFLEHAHSWARAFLRAAPLDSVAVAADIRCHSSGSPGQGLRHR